MTYTDLVKIALFLNLIADQIKDCGGVDAYFSKTPSGKLPHQNEETQCLWVSTGLWIANNNDEITALQSAYLKKLGIKSPQEVLDHVNAHTSRVIKLFPPTGNKQKYPAKYTSPKEGTFMGVFGLQTGKPATPIADLAVGQNHKIIDYRLAAANAPPLDGVVMVTGIYDSDDSSTKCHAEQKLLAAALKIKGGLLRPEDVPGNIIVGGCKAPCSVCQPIMNKFKERRPNMLGCEDSDVERCRTDAGLKFYHADDIRRLKVPTLPVEGTPNQ